MKVSVIKSILRDNKESLRGKQLEVNGVVYKTLKDFGNAIIELSKKDIAGFRMQTYICRDDWHTETCASKESALRYSLKKNRFDALKVYSIANREVFSGDVTYSAETGKAIERWGAERTDYVLGKTQTLTV